MTAQVDEFRDFVHSRHNAASWTDAELAHALAVAKRISVEGEGTDAAPGRMMIREEKWLQVWHDVDCDNRPYVRYGISVGPRVEAIPDSSPDGPPVHKAGSQWDEQQHPRDHGKFSSAPGASAESASEPSTANAKESANESPSSKLPDDNALHGAKFKPFGEGSLHAQTAGTLNVGGKQYFFKHSFDRPSDAAAEVKTADMAHAADVNVPAAKEATIGRVFKKRGVVSDWVDGQTLEQHGLDGIKPEQVQKQILFSYLGGLYDRKTANYMVDKNNDLWSIDHESTRPQMTPEKTFEHSIGGNFLLRLATGDRHGEEQKFAFDPKVVESLAERTEAVAEALKKHGDDAGAEGVRARGKILTELAKADEPTIATLGKLSRHTTAKKEGSAATASH